jgi:hypothetical protein
MPAERYPDLFFGRHADRDVHGHIVEALAAGTSALGGR